MKKHQQCFPSTILSQQIKAITCRAKASCNLHLLHNCVSPERCNFLPTPYKQSSPLVLPHLKPKHGNKALKGMATSISSQLILTVKMKLFIKL